MGFPDSSAGKKKKKSACNAGDLGSILGLGRSTWRREQIPTPVFWPGEFRGLQSFWILGKPQRDLILGQEGRGPDSCHIAVDHRDEVGVFYSPPARISSRYVVTLLESDAKKSVDKHCFPWSGRARVHGIIIR